MLDVCDLRTCLGLIGVDCGAGSVWSCLFLVDSIGEFVAGCTGLNDELFLGRGGTVIMRA